MNVQQTMAVVHVIILASINLDRTNVSAPLAMLLQTMGGYVMVSAAYHYELFTFVKVN